MLSTIIAFLVVIAIVVFVHEMGHFLVAKLNRVYVITFSFGFGPKLIRQKIGETEYAVSILPLGGYVKFAGESEDEDEEDSIEQQIPEKRLYRGKSPLQKMSVVVAGPVMNAMLALVFLVGLVMMQGLQVNPETVVKKMERGGPADRAGIRPGDRLISINGEKVDYWEEIYQLTHFDREEDNIFVLARDGDTLRANFRPLFNRESKQWELGMSSSPKPRIGKVKKGSPADKAGIKAGAVILSVNDTTISTFRELTEFIHPHPEDSLKITWEYKGEIYSDIIIPESQQGAEQGEEIKVVQVGQIGVRSYSEKVPVSFTRAIRYAAGYLKALTVMIIDFLYKLITGKAPFEALGGPVKIGAMAGDMLRWGLDRLVYFIAFFSLNLAIFNLIPLLPFDGGHFVLHLFEFVTGREINERIKGIFMQIGIVIFVILMAFIIAMDIFNLFR